MVLRSKFFLFTLSLVFDVFAADLPYAELLTKQEVHKIRFMSQTGERTIYEKHSGNLALSTNYKVSEILKSEQGTRYQIITTEIRKKMIITADKSYLDSNMLSRKKKIFVSNFAIPEMQVIGFGVDPKLHLEDLWVSYYDGDFKEIHFHSLFPPTKKFKIKINGKTNPYFRPAVHMINNSEIIYSDLNAKGQTGLFLYSRKERKVEMIHKNSTPGIKFELCQIGEQLVIGQFGLGSVESGSTISLLKTSDVKDFNKTKSIYDSPLNDIGNLICRNSKEDIIFIKNTSSPDAKIKDKSDIATISIKTKKLSLLTNEGVFPQFVFMDNNILLPYLGKYYILIGSNTYKKDQLSPNSVTDKIKNE